MVGPRQRPTPAGRAPAGQRGPAAARARGTRGRGRAGRGPRCRARGRVDRQRHCRLPGPRLLPVSPAAVPIAWTARERRCCCRCPGWGPYPAAARPRSTVLATPGRVATTNPGRRGGPAAAARQSTAARARSELHRLPGESGLSAGGRSHAVRAGPTARGGRRCGSGHARPRPALGGRHRCGRFPLALDLRPPRADL